MDLRSYYFTDPNEKPLENLVEDGELSKEDLRELLTMLDK